MRGRDEFCGPRSEVCMSFEKYKRFNQVKNVGHCQAFTCHVDISSLAIITAISPYKMHPYLKCTLILIRHVKCMPYLIRHVKCKRYLIRHAKYMRILFRHVKCMRYLIRHVKCKRYIICRLIRHVKYIRILFRHVKCMRYFNSPCKMYGLF